MEVAYNSITMEIKLKQIGSGLTLVLDKSMWAALGVDEGTHLQVTTDNGSIVIRPVDVADQKLFEAALKKMSDMYGNMLRSLAE